VLIEELAEVGEGEQRESARERRPLRLGHAVADTGPEPRGRALAQLGNGERVILVQIQRGKEVGGSEVRVAADAREGGKERADRGRQLRERRSRRGRL
jgi:hypothetical protein